MATLDYAQSGVNREMADALVGRIAQMASVTLDKRVKASIGGYASVFALDASRWIAASTDGVGTKLKLAFATGNHKTIGIDLVAMSVNDLLCVGAEPLFFLDYFATGKLQPGIAEDVLEGIVQGCRLARCALVGGETAEMPDFYSPGEYDLGGFAVGSLTPKQLLPRKSIKAGDRLIGIASSGCHSNGYSLLRKMAEASPMEPGLMNRLLTPTRIYVSSLLPLLKKGAIEGLAHITGSGFLNVPRMSEKVSYEIHLPPQKKLPEIFVWVRRQSGLSLSELAQTFNLGIGMVAVVKPSKVQTVLKALEKSGERAWEIGRVIARSKGKPSQVFFRDENQVATLEY